MSDKSKTPTVSPEPSKCGLQPFQAAAMQEILHLEPPDLILFAGPMGGGMNVQLRELARYCAAWEKTEAGHS